MTANKDYAITAVHRGPRTEWADYRDYIYYCVDDSWQIQACDTLNVLYVLSNVKLVELMLSQIFVQENAYGLIACIT